MKNQKKLVALNDGSIKYPVPKPGFINLTEKALTTTQEELLNMGLNCHFQDKPHRLQKRLECEILIGNIENLITLGKVTAEPGFKHEIVAESSKKRGNYRSQVLKKEHIEAAKELRSDPGITIRSADKTDAFVLMNTEEYLHKLEMILSDDTNFERILSDPTESLKKRLNNLIELNNAASDAIKLGKVTGNYSPGYCYGNVKTHKPGYKLRPIISQIPSPAYPIAKYLAQILKPMYLLIITLLPAQTFWIY